MDERQTTDPVATLRDLVGDPGVRLGGDRRVHVHTERGDQLVGWLGLDDLPFDQYFGEPESLGLAGRPEGFGGPYLVDAAGPQVVVDQAGIAIAGGPFRSGDGIPDRLRRGLDVHAVDLHGRTRLRIRRHVSFSNSVLRSASADMWRSRYLSIQRSWMRRI